MSVPFFLGGQRYTMDKQDGLTSTPRTRSLRVLTVRDLAYLLLACAVDRHEYLLRNASPDGKGALEALLRHGEELTLRGVQVRLASGVVLESRGFNLNTGDRFYEQRVPLRTLCDTDEAVLQVFGMRIKAVHSGTQGTKIVLDSLGFDEYDQLYIKDFEVASGHTVKKAHALQLLLDELAVEMLRWRQQLSVSPRRVMVELYDVWTPRPALEIRPPWPFNAQSKDMNSRTRFRHLTGTLSYYTQFGFMPHTGETQAMVSALGSEPAAFELAAAARRAQLRHFHTCVQPYSRARVHRSDDPARRLPSVCNDDIGDGLYFKVFEQGQPVVLFGAFAESHTMFTDPEEYFQQVIRRAKYPPLATMGLRLVRVSPEGEPVDTAARLQAAEEANRGLTQQLEQERVLLQQLAEALDASTRARQRRV